MEDEHRFVHTPTQDQDSLWSENGSLRHETKPSLKRGVFGEAAHCTNSSGSKSRKQIFVNSKSFTTLTTSLCGESNQKPSKPFHGTDQESRYFGAEIDKVNSPVAVNSSGATNVKRATQDHNNKSDINTWIDGSGSRNEATNASQMGILLPSESPFLEKAEGRSVFHFSDSVCRMDDPARSHSEQSKFDDILVSGDFSEFQDDSNGFSCSGSPTTNSFADSFTVGKLLVAEGNSRSFEKDDASTSEDSFSGILGSLSGAQTTHFRDGVLQKPLPFASYAEDGAPGFKRQLSKRKSDTTIEPCAPSKRDNAVDLCGLYDEDDEEEDDEDDEDFHSCGRRSSSCTPTLPKSRRLEDFDPYQIFEVQHSPCLILTVKVMRGRNITLGFRDLLDTPDPYINLVVKNSPDGKKCTTVKENCTNPEWNETFTFFLNFSHNNILEISLMESNYIFDINVGTVYFDIVRIKEMDKPQFETLIFNDVSEIDIELKLEFDQNPTLRYSLCLSDAEKHFLTQRKEKALSGLRKLLGESEGPIGLTEVPTIAVIGSGGGFRAMTGYSGVFKALVESGILDCTTYACGLSGSSWLLSTLYSHPKWPNMDMDEFLEELKNSVDKHLLRFFNASTIYTYAKYMVQKRKEGQPVSFTDIFGRMVGETLLNGRMECTLSDQREKIKGGNIPMPLYTCVHVKKDVPAKSFQEWVEFSPYEIGMPKYGTFMDSELFGSKFFMGKLVKKYKEQPLHFLQGIWGSAFCVLFRRLLEDNRRIDPAEMMRLEIAKQNQKDEYDLDQTELIRQEMGKELEEEGQESASDPSDDEDGEDDDEDESSSASSSLDSEGRSVDETSNPDSTAPSSTSPSPMDFGPASNIFPGNEKVGAPQVMREITVDLRHPQIEVEKLQGSSSLPSSLRKPSVNVAAVSPKPEATGKKSVNWGECPKRENMGVKDKRQAYTRAGSSFKKSKGASKSYWKKLMQGIFESNSWEFLTTRRGRAAVIHNFMRGLNLQQTYPLSPFTPLEQRVKEGDVFDGIFEMHPTSVKHIYMVDAGLTFNSPYPLVLRPQRQIDIILSFDFSARATDNTPPFKELKLAEQWAKLNRLPFPPIDTSVFDREGMKELYIFRHPTDPHCPVVFHFVLINQTFKNFKAPNIPRETEEEFEFANFDVFDDPKAPFSTFNFTYSHENFERLSRLMEFNTLLHVEDIKQAIRDVIKIKREGPSRKLIHCKDIKLLRLKSVKEMRKLKRFISRLEGSSPNACSTPSPQYYTPQPTSLNNPFFSVSNKTDVSQNIMDSLDKSRNVKSQVTHFDETDSLPAGRRNCLVSSSSCDESVFGTPPQSYDYLHQSMAEPLLHADDREVPGASQQLICEVISSTESQSMASKNPSPDSTTAAALPSPKRNPTLNRLCFNENDSGIGTSSLQHTSPMDFFTSQTKTSRDTPPNPFFVNANSRSCLSHISSSSCDSLKRTKGKKTSSLCFHNSLNKPDKTCSPAETPDTLSSSDDEFSMAPEAFKSDGTPVVDSTEAKMYFESAKAKRKLLRRQSTVSSLNSISLDEAWPLSTDRQSSEQPELCFGNSNKAESVEMSGDGVALGFQGLDDIHDLSVFNGTVEN